MSSTRGPSESAIEQDNGEYCRTLRIIFRKLDFGNGWPDRMLLWKGSIIFIEYKRKGEKPTPLQSYYHTMLRENGFTVHVVDDKDHGRKLIKEWYDATNRNLAGFRPSHDPD